MVNITGLGLRVRKRENDIERKLGYYGDMTIIWMHDAQWGFPIVIT